jgi:hypothetical protein
MRLWSLHPQYLDTKGLLAVWREGLLAQKVLEGNTRGYKSHPQLIRFRQSPNPANLIAGYLSFVHQEALNRGYAFDQSKIRQRFQHGTISVTTGQIQYEWKHLLSKISVRDKSRYMQLKGVRIPELHPIFVSADGPIEVWEKRITVTS